jgi:F-type H+-transporting ATPase subunit gamma
MASLRDIRRRIASVQKTQQITRAMRMVAAAKLRRAREAIEAARPYAEYMRATLEEVSRAQREAEHPLLAERDQVKRLEVVVVTSDRGLCGAFNANVLKYAEGLLRERRAQVEAISYTAVGRKAAEYLRRRRRTLSRSYSGLGSSGYAHAAEIARPLAERYEAGDVDEVLLVYSKFVSVLTQRPRRVRLLPFTPAEDEQPEADATPYEIEPSAEKLLAVLVPKAVEVEVYRALLENQAGEHAARMTAMESATRNTEEMIDSLTLHYNRARQAAITKELLEIVSGAEAM